MHRISECPFERCSSFFVLERSCAKLIKQKPRCKLVRRAGIFTTGRITKIGVLLAHRPASYQITVSRMPSPRRPWQLSAIHAHGTEEACSSENHHFTKADRGLY